MDGKRGSMGAGAGAADGVENSPTASGGRVREWHPGQLAFSNDWHIQNRDAGRSCDPGPGNLRQIEVAA